MTQPSSSRRSLVLVCTILVLQILVLYVSLDANFNISGFCAAGDSWLAKLFGLIHVGFAVLFLVGLATLAVPQVRKYYVISVLVLMIALPIQHWLVVEQLLHCDAF